MNVEIERKFLVQEIPDLLENLNFNSIMQGYLCADADRNEIRLRRKGDKYYLTVKNGSGRIRNETEVDISREQFDLLWPLTDGRRVEKTKGKASGCIGRLLYKLIGGGKGGKRYMLHIVKCG